MHVKNIHLGEKQEFYVLLNDNEEMCMHLAFLESCLYLQLILSYAKEGGQKTLLQTICSMNDDKT